VNVIAGILNFGATLRLIIFKVFYGPNIFKIKIRRNFAGHSQSGLYSFTRHHDE